MKDGRIATARLGKSVCGSGASGSKSNSTSMSASVWSARSNVNNNNKYIRTSTGLANAEDTSSVGSSIPSRIDNTGCTVEEGFKKISE